MACSQIPGILERPWFGAVIAYPPGTIPASGQRDRLSTFRTPRYAPYRAAQRRCSRCLTRSEFASLKIELAGKASDAMFLNLPVFRGLGDAHEGLARRVLDQTDHVPEVFNLAEKKADDLT